jgi:PBSX family phage terminase large subunit
MRERYQRLYTGAFHDRYVLGKWTAAHGAVYPQFSQETHVIDFVPASTRFFISCDYGTVNPASFGLWGQDGQRWIRLAEYYHDSRVEGVQRTDEEYADALEALAGDHPIEAVLVDPSAASFLQCLRRRGRFTVIPAKNSVGDGIRLVSSALREGKLLFHSSCVDCIREFGLYRWDSGAHGDTPRKEHDHAMDDMRYFVAHVFGGVEEQGFWVVSAGRGERT